MIPITGRPAGWCDHIARMWPVDGVVGENGAFYFTYDSVHQKIKQPKTFENMKKNGKTWKWNTWTTKTCRPCMSCHICRYIGPLLARGGSCCSPLRRGRYALGFILVCRWPPLLKGFRFWRRCCSSAYNTNENEKPPHVSIRSPRSSSSKMMATLPAESQLRK